MRDIGLLVAQSHGPDEALDPELVCVLCRATAIQTSYLTGRRVKPGPTKVGLVIILFHDFFFVFLPVLTTLNI